LASFCFFLQIFSFKKGTFTLEYNTNLIEKQTKNVGKLIVTELILKLQIKILKLFYTTH
jgi:hypothetical protein